MFSHKSFDNAYRGTRCLLIFVVCILANDSILHCEEQAVPLVQFNKDIRPILSENCYLCHGPDHSTREANLRLDIEAGITAPLQDNRQAIIRGKPEASELVRRIHSSEPDEVMPPPRTHKRLTAGQKELLKTWIAQGAPWEDHWSYIRIDYPVVPETSNPDWISNPIDQFILRRLEQQGLSPSPEADRRTLIRRLSLDLRGLPPTEAETEEFLSDGSPDAYEKLVDRLMGSSEYGEHRARYWLDAARYSDTHGFHLDNYRSIWPYRDWVVTAFNDNMPFDQFTVEQLAGDLLPDPAVSQKIATGFNRCNPTTSEGGAIDDEYLAIYAQDRVETTATVWLGMTMGCAACHDHKFDPVSQKEFYQMSAFFRNTTQKAMDGNQWDTPPSIKLYDPEQQRLRATLKKEIKRVEQRLAGTRFSDAATPSLISLVGRDAMHVRLDVSNEALILESRSGSRVIQSGDLCTTIDGTEGIRITPGTHAVIGDHANLDKDEPFTLSFWIYVPKDKLDQDVVLFGRYDPERENHGWKVELLKNRTVGFSVADNSDPQYGFQVISKDPLQQDSWNHVVLSYNALYQYDSIRTYDTAFELFVNGENPGFRGVNGKSKLYGSIAVDKPFVLGNASSDTVPQQLDRSTPTLAVSNLRIYDQVLTEIERKLLACEIETDHISIKQQEADADSTAQAEPARKISEEELLSALTQLRLSERELAILEATVPITLVMQEKKDSSPQAFVLDRGQYDLPGEQVGPGVPGVLPPLPDGETVDRLLLARWLVDPENPLPARVTVNRFWQELFGTGIVRTSEDFGSQGEPPTHLDLLNWLAAEFIQSGWDVKHMYKLMLMSSTYRQASDFRPELTTLDPDNRLLARGPRHRLDAEVIRDQALFLSKLLVDKKGGPPVKPYQPQGVWSAVAYTGSNTARFEPDSGAKLYRRSIYTFWKRTAPPPSMSIFDAPSRESCSVRRERTNTPLQALVLMNDPQFVEAARNLAEVVLRDGREDKAAALLSMVLGNPQSEDFRGLVMQSYQKFAESFQNDPSAARELIEIGESRTFQSHDPVKLAAWTMVASQIMNLDAFVMKN